MQFIKAIFSVIALGATVVLAHPAAPAITPAPEVVENPGCEFFLGEKKAVRLIGIRELTIQCSPQDA